MAKPTASTARAPFQDITGQKFGSLTAIELANTGSRGYKWRFRCDCGSEKEIRLSNIRQGVKSCGCRSRVTRLHPPPTDTRSIRQRHGHPLSKEVSLYNCWRNMLGRCYNPNMYGFDSYGGAGVEVCHRWRFGDGTSSGFDCFLTDMGAKPSKSSTLDRIDYFGNYSPDNCRWISLAAQQRNKRSNHANRFITINGITKSLSDWMVQFKATAGAVVRMAEFLDASSSNAKAA